jgi:prophage antirepressor-like protein
MSPFAHRQNLGYHLPVTSKKGVIGIGVPLHQAAQSRNLRRSCGFLVRAPSFGGSNGEPKGSPVKGLRLVPGTPTRSSCHPRLALRAAVVANRIDWRPIMAQSSRPLSGEHTQTTPFNFGTHAVRVVMRGDTPWFVAKDVCDALGYVNSRDAVADHLDADERSTVANSDGRNGGGKITIINESGLYALVLRSRKPEARKFAKWVTGEVLPSIRKTGRYEAKQKPFSLQNRRFHVWLDENGKEVVKLLTDDHYVLTAEGIAKAIKHGEMRLNEVAAIAEAAVNTLIQIKTTAGKRTA